MVDYLVMLVWTVHHDDGLTVMVVTHCPEVHYCAGHGMLGDQEGILLLVTLKYKTMSTLIYYEP